MRQQSELLKQILNELKHLRSEMKVIAERKTQSQQQVERILQKWGESGLPDRRA